MARKLKGKHLKIIAKARTFSKGLLSTLEEVEPGRMVPINEAD